jgi:aspartate carbamoyltransferase
MTGKLEPGTRFYHPLPRDRLNPVIPTFLDNTPLNGWDDQSANGYYTRIIEMALCAGHLGDDFSGTRRVEPVFEDDFIKEAPVLQHNKPEYKVGIKPVENGLVIDHIATGRSIEEIWERIDTIRKLMGLNMRSSHGVYHSNQGPEIYKGIISVPDLLTFGEKNLKRLGAIAPGCTLNLIKNHTVIQKFRLEMPPRIYNFPDISCKNENCISHPKHEEHIEPHFIRKRNITGKDIFVCAWCEREHDFSEIWDL